MGAKDLSAAQQELFEAVRKGDVEKVHTWLANKRNKRPRTPLNFLRPTTPHTAWLCSMVDPSNGYTVLHLAALQGHVQVIKILLDVDSNMLNARDRRGCLPIHLAAWNGHVEAVQILIDAEPDSVDAVNNAKESPLHLSAQHGHGKVVTTLLAKHADARLRNARAETALDIAARLGKANVCRLIICNCPELALQSAADCSSTDSGRSRHIAQVVYPLHAAARHGHIDCLQILCQSGFDLNYVTDEGSALHVAALFGKVEAVKLLLEQGISVETRDSQGRTVLDTLREHENEKASDLTQVIQSREGWSECRRLIEAHIATSRLAAADRKSSHATQTGANQSNDVCGTYQNVPPQCSSSGGACSASDMKDVVWRPIPEGASARLQSALQSPCHSLSDAAAAAAANMIANSTSSSSTIGAHRSSSNYIYHPHSLLADVVTLSSDGNEFDGVSTLSLSTTLPDPSSEHDSSGQPSPSNGGAIAANASLSNKVSSHAAAAVPRFPLTSPNNKNRHASSNRSVNLQPRMGVGVGVARASMSSGIGIKAGCSYQAPHLYDAWCPHHTSGYDNVLAPPHPLMAYDNVPRNLLIYDNAPPPGHRRWEHSCGTSPAPHCCVGSVGHASSFSHLCNNTRNDGTQTMPPVKPARARASLQANTFLPTTSRQQQQQQQLDDRRDQSSADALDRDDSSDYHDHQNHHRNHDHNHDRDRDHDCVSVRSERANSSASVVTFACSTLERSISPDVTKRTPSGTTSLAAAAAAHAPGRAPLALPEDMCGSTSTSIMSSSSISPERWTTTLDEKSRWARSTTETDENSISDKASSSTVGPSTSTQTTAVCMKHEATTTDSIKSLNDLDQQQHIQCSSSSTKPPLNSSSSSSSSSSSNNSNSNSNSHSNSNSRCDADDLPSPETTKSRIHEFLCSHEELKKRLSLSPSSSKAQQTQAGPMSPSTTDCSDCTLASSCSLPIISQISSTPPSIVSPTHERNQASKQCSTNDDPLTCSIEVRLRAQPCIHTNMFVNRGAFYEGKFNQQTLAEVYTENDTVDIPVARIGHRGRYVQNDMSREFPEFAHQTSLNESIEWRKPSTSAVANWLNISVGVPNPRAKELADILENHGFDSVNFMQSTLDRSAMHEIGLDKSTQHQIGSYLENYPGQRNVSANTFTYVSDWLHSLDLEDYLGHFMNGGLTSMPIVVTLDPNAKHLKSLGIILLGHQRRILQSLKEAKEERRQRATERLNAAAMHHEDETDSGQESRSTAQSSSTSIQKPHSIIVGGRQTEWRHSCSTLIDDCVSYSAHYLGSMEISNVEGTEDSRRAMIKLKKGIREIAKVPQVLLEISVSGVRVLDATTKQLTVEHEITRIQIVCQDERDLNCFAYISQDGDKHFCHVFCVLTADVATEIIITLGQAFEVCYRLANGTYGGAEPIVINPVP